MKRKLTEVKQNSVCAEYLKGTPLRLIEAIFGISRAGIYWILKENNVKPNRRGLTTKK